MARHAPATRYLIIKLGALGDVIMASSVVQRLRAEEPDCRITWLVGASAAPLVALFPGVDEMLKIDDRALFHGSAAARAAVLLRLWPRLLTRKFDRALLLHVDSRYRVITAPLRGVRASQLRRRSIGDMLPIPGRYLGDEYARVLDDANLGPLTRRYDIVDLRERVAPTGAGQKPPGRAAVALAPGGARNLMRENPTRRWPVESYAALAEQLLKEGYAVSIVGSESDAWVRPSFAHLDVVDHVGTLSIRETLARLATSDVVVTHDSGPLHFARAVRTPAVALFGPTNPREMVGSDATVRVLWGGEHLACRPCYDGREFTPCADNLCMKSVSVAQVLAAVTSVLR